MEHHWIGANEQLKGRKSSATTLGYTRLDDIQGPRIPKKAEIEAKSRGNRRSTLCLILVACVAFVSILMIIVTSGSSLCNALSIGISLRLHQVTQLQRISLDDAVVTCVTGDMGPIDLFLYSLRATGYSERIIVIHATDYDSNWLGRVVLDTRAELFSLPYPEWQGNYQVRDRVRWLWLWRMLEVHPEIGRIFVAGFDCFFLRDPFSGRGSAGLEVYGKGSRICDDGSFGAASYDSCGGLNESRCEEIVTCGAIFGGRCEMIALAEMFVDGVGRRGCHTDQGLLNTIFWGGGLRALHASADLTGLHVMSWPRIKRIERSITLGSHGPAVLHQWNRDDSLSATLYQMTPRANPRLIRAPFTEDSSIWAELLEWHDDLTATPA